MAIRRADARWDGTFQDGTGSFEVASGAFQGTFTAGTRFGDDPGTNPEELVGAAHAGCFSMAFALALGKAGHEPESVRTTANVRLEKLEAFTITGIELVTEVKVSGIDEAEFQEIANASKESCPVSRALASVPIELKATMVS
jgi:lipoyl-dependent peroxiredoxin